MSLSVAKNSMHRAIEELFCRKLTMQELTRLLPSRKACVWVK